MEEPLTPTPRPCSTAHSAPVQRMRYDPGPLTLPHEINASDTTRAEPHALTPEQQRREEIDDFLDAYGRIAPGQERRDGWKPFLRKLFLQVIAEGGGISAACAYTKMSRSAAYALEARDRVFAAGWAAAAHFARNPMAEDLYEKGKHGITETITRSDGATITRHRFDGRLSVAVLNRLDRRCDRAEERGSVHLAAVRNWDEFMRLVGAGDDKAAEALLDRPLPGQAHPQPGRRGETAQQCPTCTLPERANPIPAPDPPGLDLSERCWKSDDGTWVTSFPPPPGFDGHQNREWDGFNYYERACTPDEAALLDARETAAEAAEQAELTAFAEAQRDRFFASLRTGMDALELGSVAGAGGRQECPTGSNSG